MHASPRLRILVVDDQPAVRAGLARLVRGACGPDTEVRTAATVADTLRELSLQPPDVTLLDIDLAGEDGLAVMPQLLPACRVLVLTSHGDAATRVRARNAGAHMFIEKSAPAAVLLAQLTLLIQSLPPASRGEFPPTSTGAFDGVQTCEPSVANAAATGHSPSS